MSLPFIVSIENTPQAMTPIALSSLHNNISDPKLIGASLSSLQLDYKKPTFTFDEKSKVGSIEIRDVMLYRTSWITKLLGIPTYEQIANDVETLLQKGAKRIALIFDSSGSEWYSNIETAQALRNKANRAGAKLIAYVDGSVSAGAYVIASACSEVVANPESSLGGLGISVLLRNSTQAEKKAGVETTYVYGGDSKIPYNKDGDWRADFIDDIQNKVDAAYDQLCKFVADNRRLSIKAIKDTQAKVFNAEKALSLGMADSIMTREQFSKYLMIGSAPSKTTKSLTPRPKANVKPIQPTSVKPQQQQTQTTTSQTNSGDGVKKYLEKIYANEKK